MFKNPLKYQKGGQLNEQQQQILAAFIDWLPKRVKEFQGMQPDAIVQALDGMSKTPEGQKQVQQLMEQFQQESQSVPSAKRGGKIQDFICKHGKGGAVAGCGCEKPVEKHQQENGKGRGIIDFPQYTVAQDTTFFNPRGEKINQRVIVDKNGQAYKWNTVNGINPIVIGGYWDGQFTPEGDDAIPVQRFDSLFRRAIPKQKTQSNQNIVKDQNPAGPMPVPGVNGQVMLRVLSDLSEAYDNKKQELIEKYPFLGKVDTFLNGPDYIEQDNPSYIYLSGAPMFKIGTAGIKGTKVLKEIQPVTNATKTIVTKAGKPIIIVQEGVYGSEKAAQRALKEPGLWKDMSGTDPAEAAKKVNGLRKWLYGGWYNSTTNLPK